ncbi:hypothetical protein ASG43_05040 [Aureimonas sp. Leaf454]|uniref:hypothetical protein n=1 Tax=Aureimonas sp. Leaf454 TaxID=1736381 RepID=UPI0006F1FDD1|nr:hypothetical protein [Aureimonas sp. Leaf454]KQT50657.1 hypothetical protein ASG43_05040 [Aureimonas sp. Leaf454]
MTRDTGHRASLRHVKLALAREKGHPDGDPSIGYDIIMPLREDGRIDPDAWSRHRADCRVRSFGPHGERIGHLLRKPGGSWVMDDEEGDEEDQKGFRFNDEIFVPGEYVSIRSGGAMHTFRIVSVEKP